MVTVARLRQFALFFISQCLISIVYPMADNMVRVDRFKWQVAQTEHFDIYYDKTSAAWLPLLTRYVEKAWEDVGQRMDYPVPGRTPFFFFVDHNRFEQNNIVQVGEGTGGVTEAFKNRLSVFNDGSQNWLQHVIPHEFTHVVQFNVLYGGFWKSVRLLKSPFYPLWLMEGLAEYGSGEVDRPMSEMVVRDAVYHNILPHLQELHGFNHLRPNQVTLAYKTGHAAVDFLADEYGRDKVGKSLVLMKDYFEVSSVLSELVGCDLELFDFRFREYLTDRYARFFSRALEPERYGPALTPIDGIPQFNQAPALSPDGKTLYYIGDQAGPDSIFKLDLADNRREALIKTTFGPFENIHSQGRALSVSRDGRWLAFAGEKKQRDFLYLFDLTKRKLRRVKVPFDQIRSPVFSPVNDNLVCVAMDNGVNDLYLISMKGKIIDRLTENLQDETDPSFSLDGSKVVFSAEVVGASNLFEVGRDIFEMNLADKTVRRVTDLPGLETEPVFVGQDAILFVRDRDEEGPAEVGGFNLYQYEIGTSSLTRLTNVIGGAFLPTFSPADRQLYFVGFNAGEKRIYRYSDLIVSTAGALTGSDRLSGDIGDTAPAGDNDMLTDRSAPPSLPNDPMSFQFLREDLQSSLLMGAPRPYRFRASTDFFLPFLFYSTLDGLVFANIWQASDYLGNHTLQQQLQYASGNNFLDLGVFYTYSRFRPNLTLGVRNQHYYRDYDKDDYRRELNVVGLMTYPLDRVNSFILGLGAKETKETYAEDPASNVVDNDRYFLAGVAQDTVTGRYLTATRGRRFEAVYQQGSKALNGNLEYKSGLAQGVAYLPLPGESALVGRLMYGRSVGPDPRVFRLGGGDRLRGLSGGSDLRKSNALLSSFEWRQRLGYLNARTKWLFPDFFFKAAYLIVFDDYGYSWDHFEETDHLDVRRANNAAGLGLMWPLFILQTYQLNFSVQWAARTDASTQIWYISVGPSF